MAKTHIEYSSEKELDAALEKIIGNNPDFIPLVDGEVRVAACFVIRMNDDDETIPPKGAPVKIVKVPPALQVFMAGKIKPSFILVVDKHWWDNSPDKTREGAVGRYLYRIEIQKTDDGLVLKKTQFDIQESSKAIVRYGRFDEPSNNLADLLTSMTSSHIRRKAEPKPEPEPEDPDAEPPRVVARPMPKKPAKPVEDDDKPLRPARKIPDDPKPAVTDEPPEAVDE